MASKDLLLSALRLFPGLQPIALAAASEQRFGRVDYVDDAVIVSSRSGFHFLGGKPSLTALAAVKTARHSFELKPESRHVLVPYVAQWTELLTSQAQYRADWRLSYRLSAFKAPPPAVRVEKLRTAHLKANPTLAILSDTMCKWGSSAAVLSEALVSVVTEGDLVLSCAASSAIAEGTLEINVFTLPEARGRDLAYAACHHLIRSALARGIQPHWNCVVGNVASQRLAQRLGFKQVARYPIFVSLPIK